MARQETLKAYTFGIFLAVLAALFSTLLGVLAKGVGSDINRMAIIWYRDIVSIIFLIPILMKDKHFTFKIQSPLILFSRIAFGLICMGTYFWACELIPITNAVLLLNTSPVFVPLILFIIIRKKTSKIVLAGIVLSFIGMTIVISPNPRDFSIFSIIGLISGIALAFNYILTRFYVQRHEHGVNSLLFWYFLTCIVVATPVVIWDWTTPTLTQLLMLIGTGFVGVLYQLTQNNALRYITPKVAACLAYMGIVWAAIFGLIFWNTVPDLTSTIAMLITIAGAIIVIVYDSDRPHKDKEDKEEEEK